MTCASVCPDGVDTARVERVVWGIRREGGQTRVTDAENETLTAAKQIPLSGPVTVQPPLLPFPFPLPRIRSAHLLDRALLSLLPLLLLLLRLLYTCILGWREPHIRSRLLSLASARQCQHLPSKSLYSSCLYSHPCSLPARSSRPEEVGSSAEPIFNHHILNCSRRSTSLLHLLRVLEIMMQY